MLFFTSLRTEALARSLSLRFTSGVQRLDMPGGSANQKTEEITALSNLQLSSEDRKSDLAFLEEHPSVWYFEMSCSLHLEMGYLQKATFPLQTANIDVHSFEPLKPNITGDIAQWDAIWWRFCDSASKKATRVSAETVSTRKLCSSGIRFLLRRAGTDPFLQ